MTDLEKMIGLAVGGIVVTSVVKKIAESRADTASRYGGDKFQKTTALPEEAKAQPGVKADPVSAAQQNSIIPAPVNTDHIISLRNKLTDEIVEFVVMPEIVEDRGVAYEAIAPPQFPGAFQKYRGTESVRWTVTAMLVSRNSAEARVNYDHITTLRSWTMPYFGENSKIDKIGDGANVLGAPPPVLEFKGYRGVVGSVPVVITSLNWNWPRDVDYIPIEDGNPASKPFPAVINVTINLTESFSTTEFNQFDLTSYWEGDMVGAYNKPVPRQQLTDQSISERSGAGVKPTNQKGS
jgi:hypothetical protein